MQSLSLSDACLRVFSRFRLEKTQNKVSVGLLPEKKLMIFHCAGAADAAGAD